MPVQEKKLNINADRYETEVRGTPMFPCGGYYYSISANEAYEIPWHWHEEFEVVYVLKGDMRLSINGTQYALRENEGVFINSNALHLARIECDKECEFCSLVFFGGLVSGAVESVYEQRYIRPLANCGLLPSVIFRCESEWQRQASQCIKDAYDAYDAEEYGYELMVREKLSHMLYLIVLNKQDELERQKAESMDILRIKAMLNYMHRYYAEPIELQQIAAAANIGGRECLRCFQRTLGLSPMQYLLKFRVSVSARLLTDTDLSVTEICSRSGFDSASYFSKMFKRIMGYTPSMYRKLRKGQGA